MSDDNGNVTIWEKFRQRVSRDVFIPPKPRVVATPEEAAKGEISDWANGSREGYESLMLLIDTFRERAEATENTNLANQPLMLFHHGRVAAFKELKAFLESVRRDAPSA